jgi:molybdopterin-guanine dinucleotide biosynthesis protein A
MGGRSKAAALLGGQPLASYPAAALGGVCSRVAVVCKAATSLPELPGVERWEEPDQPRHPLTGIVFALERARGPVLVCAADMPFVTADACRTLMQVGGDANAVVAVAGGVLQPVFGLYAPAALKVLRKAEPGAPLTETVEALDPMRVALPPGLVRSIDTPEELAEAEALLAGQG